MKCETCVYFVDGYYCNINAANANEAWGFSCGGKQYKVKSNLLAEAKEEGKREMWEIMKDKCDCHKINKCIYYADITSQCTYSTCPLVAEKEDANA